MSGASETGKDGLVAAATYSDLVAARVALSALEGSGIPAWLFDAGHASAAPALYQALGLRVMVRGADLARARELLASGSAIDGFETCPNCSSDRIFRGKNWFIGLAGLVVGNMGFAPVTSSRRCLDCGHRWRVD